MKCAPNQAKIGRLARKCKTCKGCRECTLQRTVLSLQETKILKRTNAQIQIDPTTGEITASYPWKLCRERVVSIKEQVRKLQTKTKTLMIRDGTHH